MFPTETQQYLMTKIFLLHSVLPSLLHTAVLIRDTSYTDISFPNFLARFAIVWTSVSAFATEFVLNVALEGLLTVL
jgi:hypothetical protein